MITLEGQLEKITYHNPENHYTVARFRSGKDRHLVTIVAHIPTPSTGESLRVSGDWETHPRFGSQFKVESCETLLPTALDAIEEYLSSGILPGVGPKLAARIVDHFTDKTLETIEEQPDRLLEVPGIGESMAARIVESWERHHALRQLMRFLQEHGIPMVHGAKIVSAYGDDAVPILKEDPYRITRDIPGIGFSVADALAAKLGFSETDPERIRACLRHLLTRDMADGHMCADKEALLQRSAGLIHVEPMDVVTEMEALISSGELIEDTGSDETCGEVIFLADAYRSERETADRLQALLTIPLADPGIETDHIVGEVLRKLAIRPSDEQLSVLENVLSQRVAIITGGPGTGKTTLIRSITAILSFMGRQCLLAAPTGRAARRLSEVTHRGASTVHKLLGFSFVDDHFVHDQDNPLEADTVIIDEASMLDAFLMHHLIKAVPMTAALILVGDVFQLPSVGPGSVLSDLIASGIIPTFELSTIYRQAQESPIVMNAHKVRTGNRPDLERTIALEDRSEFRFIHQTDPRKSVDQIVELCSESIPGDHGLDSIADIQVITPMHKGQVGTVNLNQVLQDALNPHERSATYRESRFRLADKVMHLKNNYQKDVFNGDIGTVREIDSEVNRITVDYDGWFVEYDHEEFHELSLAYAISIHKSQGSEYPAVVVPLMTQHFPLLQRNLIYTAMTRGKQLVVFIGTEKALDIALMNDRPQQRLTGLADRLRSM